jgi:hypothetical protein
LEKIKWIERLKKTGQITIDESGLKEVGWAGKRSEEAIGLEKIK